jgi:FKBP-type peptidyl-prolyl cis-trans isomerase FklB
MPAKAFVFFVSALIGLAVACEWTTAQEAVGAKVSDPASYLVGLDVGNGLAQSGFVESDFNFEQFIKGIRDALAKREPALSEQELETVSTALNSKMKDRAEENMKQRVKDGEANAAKAQAFLQDNQKKDGVQTTKSGLQYVIIKKGQGKTPGQASVVRVHYEGKLMSGKVFDSSVKRNMPFDTPVSGNIIEGWTEALQRMAVGDKWQIFIPPKLGYGMGGSPGGEIGPNELLIFELELLDILQ